MHILNQSYNVPDYAPSFEESDTALQAIIEKSDVFGKLKIHDAREDEFQLKPVYQILLNFIWISLKVSFFHVDLLFVMKVLWAAVNRNISLGTLKTCPRLPSLTC